MTSVAVHLDQQVLDLLIGAVLPLLVGIITKRLASSALKASVLALLSVISGTLVQIGQDGGDFDLKTTLVSIAVTWVTGGVLHQNFWKPTGISDKVAGATADVGLGRPRDEHGRFVSRSKT